MKFSIGLLCLLSFICSDHILTSQSLEVELSNGGIVFPSMSLDERNALTPNTGQCIFNIESNTLDCYDGADWISMLNDREFQIDQSPKTQSVLRPVDFTNVEAYGQSTHIDGANLIVGDPFDEDKGAVYIYTYNGLEWIQKAFLTEEDGDSDYQFGYSVFLEGDVAIVGAPLSRNNNEETGAVYSFKQDGSSWIPQDTIHAIDGGDADRFGESISMHDEFLIVGSPRSSNDGDARGRVYIYELIEDKWSLDTILTPTSNDTDTFGQRVVSSRGYIVVANEDYSRETDSVYIYKRTGEAWSLIKSLRSESDLSEFGPTLALEGSELYVTGRKTTDEVDTDYIFVFKETLDGDWKEVQAIEFDEPSAFYSDIRLAATDNLLVTAYYSRQNGGVVMSYHRNGSDWKLKNRFTPFGTSSLIHSLSLSNDCMALGMREFTTDNIEFGGIFIY